MKNYYQFPYEKYRTFMVPKEGLYLPFGASFQEPLCIRNGFTGNIIQFNNFYVFPHTRIFFDDNGFLHQHFNDPSIGDMRGVVLGKGSEYYWPNYYHD